MSSESLELRLFFLPILVWHRSYSLQIKSLSTMLAFINNPLLFAIIIVALIIYYAATSSKNRNLPDGPKGWPLLGVLPDKNLELHQQLYNLIPRYGDFFSFNLGMSKVVVISSPRSIDDLIVKKGSNFSSRPTSSSQAKIVAQDRLVQLEYGDMFRVRLRHIPMISCQAQMPK